MIWSKEHQKRQELSGRKSEQAAFPFPRNSESILKDKDFGAGPPFGWGRHYSKRGWSKRMINEGVCEGVLSDPPTGIFCVVTRADALRSSPRSKLSGSTR